MEIINVLLIIILIILTAFFVATEFSIVKVRATRIDQLITEGNKNAEHAKKIIDNLDAYLSATQLGITVTALGLGWLGEPTVQTLIKPVFEKLELNAAVSSFLSFAIAFFIITFLNVVVGELAPKSIAIQRAETVTLMLAKPLILFYKVLFPFIWLLNSSSRLFIRMFGFRPVNENEVALSEEELRLILSESYKSGEINQAEMMYVNNVFEFDDRVAKEIMVPRTEMICFFKDSDVKENITVVQEGQFTRYPVVEGDKDHVVGLVNIKELFTNHLNNEQESIIPLIRPIIHVSETTPIKQVLIKMQKERIHMAIVIDEYGGTAGLVTVEDILEEIVGEIRDEFDFNEKPMIEKLSDTETIVAGKVLLDEINDLFGTDLKDDEVDTIGGWIITNNLDAKQGTVIEYGGYQFIVDEIEGYQIKKVRIVNNNR
ncbi:hemolysin family protein [Lentibacillus sp. Marseille-P4043]|uniref:hemolysin family protein n=1 Tax=Lentibacillus sp. Marseille-P4043 TaxID=2040293 RepID=UPI000D0B341C|nr:hemolysin family protein [Lentibacillus sp. Marseille-P4043]